MPASENRRYYLVRTRAAYDGIEPDIDGLDRATFRYLSTDIAVVRDPDGVHDFPPATVDSTVDDLPLLLPLDLTQAEVDALCAAQGLASVDIESLAADRVGGD
ncbi:hypothetical protein ACJO2E_08615 [Marinobacter sp. M1N3S26]|uniref:hypothetical protein n=1 Tax=Marinobacter sp. M1N3S26 TaxID=3382299 RepID=UPI00387B1DD3